MNRTLRIHQRLSFRLCATNRRAKRLKGMTCTIPRLFPVLVAATIAGSAFLTAQQWVRAHLVSSSCTGVSNPVE